MAEYRERQLTRLDVIWVLRDNEVLDWFDNREIPGAAGSRGTAAQAAGSGIETFEISRDTAELWTPIDEPAADAATVGDPEAQ